MGGDCVLAGADNQQGLLGWAVTAGDRWWQYLVVADEQGRLGAQRGEDPRDLHRDVSGPDDDAAPAGKRRCRGQAPGAGAGGCGGRTPLYLGSSSSSKKPSLVIPRLAPAKQRPFCTLSPFPFQSLLCFGRPLRSLGDFIGLTRNFTVGRDDGTPPRGNEDVRSRVLLPIHLDGWLGISGELPIAADYVNVSLRDTVMGLTAG